MATRLAKAVRSLLPQNNPPPKPGEARGTVSGYTIGVSPLWGQPYPEQASGDAAGLITRQRMREVVLRTPTAAASMNAILDFAGGVEIDIRNVDAAKPISKMQANKVRRLMMHPNKNQTRRQFLLTLMRDIITFGYAAVELVQTGQPEQPVEMWVMDSARLRIDFDEHGYIHGYDMFSARGVPIVKPTAFNRNNLADQYNFPVGNNMGFTGQPSVPSESGFDYAYPAFGANMHGWEPDEVIFFALNPISESVYPHSRIVQLFTAALLEDLMIQFISERFTDSNIPFGVFDLGDVTETELRTAIDNWNSQGRAGNRILMTGSKAPGSKWMPFGYHLKDLEANALLAEFRMKIMGILGVTAQELGESQDINKSNGYNLSFTFKKRALEPLLDEITETLTKRLLWDVLGYTDLEFYYEEIDSRDEFLMSQIDMNYQKLGIFTPNEIRNRKGLTSVSGGDDNLIFTSNSVIPIDMVRKYAQTLIDIEQQTQALGATGAGGLRVRESLSRPGQDTPKGTQAAGAPATNGHNRGASAAMASQITGRPSSNPQEQ